MKRGRFDECTAAKFIQNVLAALVYLHEEAKVVHRDIKPENLMLLTCENDFEVKIADFGLATKYEGDNLHLRCGSPGYLAPEILKN